MPSYASLGQYQSFALIAYDAIRLQTQNVNTARYYGQSVIDFVKTLYCAKKAADFVLAYSTSSLSAPGITENDVIAVCDYLKNTLMFDCAPLYELSETYLNPGAYDFNPFDFNTQDFA